MIYEIDLLGKPLNSMEMFDLLQEYLGQDKVLSVKVLDKDDIIDKSIKINDEKGEE